VVYLLICLWFGIAGAVVARIKGQSMVLWFLISAVVPVLGLLALVLSRNERHELRRQCPTCGKVIKLHDTMCMRCGTDLDFPDVAIVPEAEAPARRG
jgi:hypothetical protein